MDLHVWKIEWSDRLSVGIPEIDRDHQHFASLVNGFNKAIVDRMELAESRTRLTLILDDAVEHFAYEERLFAEWKYPDVEAHSRRHAEIIATLRKIIGQVGSDTLMPQSRPASRSRTRWSPTCCGKT